MSHHDDTTAAPLVMPTAVQLIVVAVVLVAAVTLGRAVFITIALAVLLSFVLNPLVHRLKRLRFGRIASVLTAVSISFLLLAGLGVVIARQIGELARDLPRYEATLRQKVQDLRGLPVGGDSLQKATETLSNLGSSAEPPPAGTPAAIAAAAAARASRPQPVEIRSATEGPLEAFQRFLATVLTPLASGGVVVVLVVSILLQQEDLRDRIIRLVGTRDLERTTRAMDDAAGRLSRYYLAQTIANAAYGAALALGLLVIGVPNALLWGITAGVLRFVPQLGGLLAALLPLALAAAVDAGWTMVLATAALFIVAEIVMSQLVESRFRGRATGLSPLAGILAMMFWTWAWGPIGLVLATPLTVLLIVLGKHVDRLDFLEVLLGAAPALTPVQAFYQRLLAANPEAAASQAESQLEDCSFVEYADEIALPGLQLAQADFKRGTLNETRMTTVLRSTEVLVEYLPPPSLPAPTMTDTVGNQSQPVDVADHVLIVGGRTALDCAAGMVLARLLADDGITATVLPATSVNTNALSAIDAPINTIAISYLDSSVAETHARFLVRRLRRTLPNVPIVVCAWQDSAAGDVRATGTSGADSLVATMREAAAAIIAQKKPARLPTHKALIQRRMATSFSDAR
jgi:predicted PurR-regulated permease PerM